ncbi:MAG: hypothetical protein DI586_00590 [Micavibrio aeruginosavorus]|uniref:Pyrrolo-quinoline quinone repeat domain-containing protein n=1 Tax=Micavibrio aeruginosavorus TaxID=349221 RepID=A0A2W5HPC1_9BACT|nr:MAG: hypothetical protein DI586_00590 [Micavibrio aeruginosavorus]
MRSIPRIILLTSCATLSLSACSWFESKNDEVPLPGARISVLELQKNLEPKDNEMKSSGFVSPEPWKNEFWPQAGGYPNHAMQNLALNNAPLKKLWDADIGEGSQAKLPLVAQPVVFDKQVFTLDTEGEVRSFDLATGKKLWEKSVRPETEDEDVISGGLAFSAGKLFVTSGYNELLALNPADGKTIWKQKMSSPSRAAPSILNDRVFVVTLENKIVAFDANDGKQLWDYQALSEVAGIVGAASPAVNNDLVIPAFSSGEIIALRVGNGSVAWMDDLSPTTRVGGLSALPDIQGLPVIDKDLAFAISFGGKMVAIDINSGQRTWEKEMSGTETPWVVGNMIFVLSANSELVAMNRASGAIAWVLPLASYIEEDGNRLGLLWNGPVLAGSRLIVTGPEGNLLEVDPNTGKVIRRMKLDDTVAVSPVIASGTLLLLTQDGNLTAYH